MWLKTLFNRSRQLAFRLVFWNIVGFVLAAWLTFALFDNRVAAYLNRRLDRQLETKLLEIKGLKEPGLDRNLFMSEIEHHSQAMGVENLFYRLLDSDHRPLIQSDLSNWSHLNLDALPEEPFSTHQMLWDSLESEKTNGPGARVVYLPLGSGEVVQVGLSTLEHHQLRALARTSIGAAMFLVTLLGAVLTAFIAARVLKSMQTVSRGVVSITKRGDFDQRIGLPTGSRETDDLAETFNRVFSKIQDLMARLDQVLGDIAHDMRSPVTRLRGAAESLLSEPDVTEREEDMAGHAIEECDRILGLVNTILEITAAESNMMAFKDETLDFSKLVREGVDLFKFMIEDKKLHVNLALEDGLEVRGDRGLLQRILSNLLDNAVKYTASGGTISLCLNRVSNLVRLQVKDTGIGVPDGESELIFRRFYRGDRNRTLPGNGLGLTFCRAVLTSMGGQIFHLHAQPGPGSVFTVELPQVKEGTMKTGPFPNVSKSHRTEERIH